MKHSSIGSKALQCIISLLPLVAIVLLTKIFFREMYLFEWFFRHGYFGLWFIVVIIAIFNFKLSFVISCSNSIAIILGQFIGDIVHRYTTSQITSDMSMEQQAQLHLHHGFVIWFFLLFSFLVMYFIITSIQEKLKYK